MSDVDAAQIGLIDRPPGAILFRGVKRDIDAEQFLYDVQRCADALPEAAHAVNGCTDRYWFAVGFCACLLRGQLSLLTGDFSPRGLQALEASHGNLYALSDREDAGLSLPQHVIRNAGAGAVRVVPRVPATQPAIIVFTSGSTGAPVGTVKSFGELALRSRAAAAVFGFAERNPASIIGTVPAHHMYGFETTILLPLHAAVSSWRDPVFYPADLRAPLARSPAPHVLVTTPLQLRAMLQAPACGTPELVISATAPLDGALAAEAERLWGCQVKEIFGASEVGSIASRHTVAEDDWSPYPGISLEGEDGPSVHAPGAPPRRLSDVVEGAVTGRFRLVGRCGDLVKLGGRRASLAGLTHILTAIPGVEDGAFLAPDDLDRRPTARLAAFVVAPALSDGALLDRLRMAIDTVFLPRPLIRLARLPRNGLGKLPREALVSLLAQHAERADSAP